ncbi:MAG: glycoside hydrolase family 5 protein [Pseudomonadota bacterium]
MIRLGLVLALAWSGAAFCGSAVEAHGSLAVVDGRVVDQHFAPLSLAGPSLFWINRGWGSRAPVEPSAYYNREVVAQVKRDWNATIIRIAMGVETKGGYLEDPEGRWAKLVAVADAAVDLGLYFIVDWHSHHAENHPEAAVAFFTRVAERYGATPNLIYEIYNEPLPDTDWRTDIVPYALPVIRAIRALDADNLIVVGSPSWSQDLEKPLADPITGWLNIAYSLHFYAGTHGSSLRDRATRAIAAGLPVVVTEWGSVDATGDGAVALEETRRWLDWMREQQLTHLGWSLHSKAEGASMLTRDAAPDGSWDDSHLTESGRLFRQTVRNWHQKPLPPSQP